jgi:hypothetical protein
MRAITAATATLAVFGVLAASAPARADWDDYDGGWRRHEWREHQWRERQWQEQRWHEHERRERAWQAYAPPPVAYARPGYYTRRRPTTRPLRLLTTPHLRGPSSRPQASRSGLASAEPLICLACIRTGTRRI